MADVLIKRNMRLYGLPYQFMESVDPRVDGISKTIGRKFGENIILDAPVISIIPGRPKYLSNNSTSESIITGATGDFSVLQNAIKGTSSDNVRFYDFEKAYSEYMKYVNILCRTCATFLELTDEIDGTKCQRYDYRNYKWNTESYAGDSSILKVLNSLRSSSSAWKSYLSANKTTEADINVTTAETTINTNPTSTQLQYETTTGTNDESMTLEELISNYNYVQFFVDSDVTASDSMSNTTTESKLKGIFDTGSDLLKELAFMVNSGGIDAEELQNFSDTSIQSLADQLKEGNGITTTLSRMLSLSSNVVKGENVVMPDIYQSSSYEKSYSFTVHLKTPYGSKFGYFMDICVPMMHLLALGIPKQTTANTYGAPFLVKAYVEGVFSCNMGIVSSIQLTKPSSATSYSVDGLPLEVDVTVSIADLYSDLSMSPQSSPILFCRNSSLIEYLAVTCGLSLITPNIQTRMDTIVNSISNAFFDIDNTIIGGISDAVDAFTMDFLGLIW